MEKNAKTIPFKCILEVNYGAYFNFNRLKSYRPYVHMYMLNGGRGIGKSTGVYLDWYKEYNKTKAEFVLVRRYPDEAKQSRTALDPMFSGVSTMGIGVKGCFAFMNGNNRLGYCVSLSAQHKLKSGVDFSKVKYIIYDEYTILQNATRRYIQNEPIEFFELLSTIVRTRKDYYVYMIGNNLDRFNPYHEFFNVPQFENIWVDKERGIYCEYCKTKKELLELEKETPLYNMIKGTAYGDYHYDNKLLTTTEGRIGEKENDAELLCRFVYNTITLNIYYHNGLEIFVEYKNKVIKDNITYIIYEKNFPNYFFIKRYRQSSIKNFIDACYGNSEVTYDSDGAVDVFSRLMEELK